MTQPLEHTPLEAVLRQDRWVVSACLLFVSAVAWLYLLAGAGMDRHALEHTRVTLPPIGEPGYRRQGPVLAGVHLEIAQPECHRVLPGRMGQFVDE